jgi:prepilin-type N-terminal cleavage/methylation domain-containing protein
MRSDGFSIVELVVVIGIMSILLSIVSINFHSWQVKYNIEKQTKELLADLTDLRLRAMHTKDPVRVTLQTGSYAFKTYSSAAELSEHPDQGTVVMSKLCPYPLKKASGADITGTTVTFDANGFTDSAETTIAVASPGNNDSAFNCISIDTARTRMGKLTDGSCNAK